jgi:hypothetical protein
MADPAVAANFVELRRITSELADVEVALSATEDLWLDIEERAPSGEWRRGAPPSTSGKSE